MDLKLCQEIAALPLAERLTRYDQLAERALQMAVLTYDRETRREYLTTAAEWRDLAREAEREL